MRFNTLALASLVCSIAASAAAWAHMPDRVPIHWNIHGQVDGWGPRAFAAGFGPGLVLLLWIVLGLLVARRHPVGPERDGVPDAPRPESTIDAEGDVQAREIISGVVLAYIAIGHAMIVAFAAGVRFDITRGICLAISALFVLIGNFMGKLRPNAYAGIRTPWTLRSPTVWRSTHRLAGITMVGAGLLSMLIALVAPTPVALGSLIALTLLGTLSPAVYSYVRRDGAA